MLKNLAQLIEISFQVKDFQEMEKAGRMIAGEDWRFECVMGTLCLVLTRLYEER